MARKKVYTVPVREADKKLIIKLSKRYKLSMLEITGYLYEQCDKFDMKRAGWEERARASNEKADQERNRYSKLDRSCANMTFAKGNFVCVRANLGKPPTIRALAVDTKEASNICGICEEDTRKKLDRNETLERVQVLENKLKVRSTEKFKVPVCIYGAHLAADGINFVGCQLNPGKNVSVETYCKVRMNGKPCSSYLERLIGVGSKLK